MARQVVEVAQCMLQYACRAAAVSGIGGDVDASGGTSRLMVMPQTETSSYEGHGMRSSHYNVALRTSYHDGHHAPCV